MNTVLFSFKGEKVPSSNTTLPNKEELFAKLRERELRPLVSVNGESAFDERGVEVAELLGESDTRSLGHASLESVGLIVNRLDRSFRLGESISKSGAPLSYLPETWQHAHKPFVNENAMRSLAHRKERVQNEILEPLGLGMPTQLIRTPLDAVLFANENPADEYIVKPNSGSSGKGVRTVTAADVASIVLADSGSELIIQPKYDFTMPMHPGVKPYDVMSTEAFESLSKSEATKEIRMYGFLSPQGVDKFPAGRVLKDGLDHWFFIDPESVPQEVYDDTEAVMRSAAEVTGSIAVSGTVDFGYGSLNGETAGHKIIEFNGKMPYMIGYDKHPEIASTLRDKFARQIDSAINRAK